MGTTTADAVAAVLAAFPGSSVVTRPRADERGEYHAPDRRERDRRHAARRILAAVEGTGRGMTAERLAAVSALGLGETRRALAAMARAGIITERRQGSGRKLYAAR